MPMNQRSSTGSPDGAAVVAAAPSSDGAAVVASPSPDGAAVVVLSWDGNREAVGRALAEVVGADAVNLTTAGAEVSIAGNPVEIKPRLVESVLRAGGKLQGLEDRGPTLEDLFLRLTGAAPDEGEDRR